MGWTGDLGGDLRWALRGLRKRPTFTVVAVATLALGIGSNSAIFTLVSAHFLAPLPYDDPGDLVLVWEAERATGDVMTVSPGNFFAWKEEARSFADLAAFNVDVATVSGGDGAAEQVTASLVTPDFFRVLGVRPELGGFFAADAVDEASGDLVVLGHALWVRRFAADPSIVGKDVRIDGRPHTVVGVAPAGFRQPERSLELAGRPALAPPAAGRPARRLRLPLPAHRGTPRARGLRRAGAHGDVRARRPAGAGPPGAERGVDGHRPHPRRLPVG